MCKLILSNSLKEYLVKLFIETDPEAEFSIEIKVSKLPTGEVRYSLEDISRDSIENIEQYEVLIYEDVGLSVFIDKSQLELFSNLQIDYKEVEAGKRVVVFTKPNT